jgi:hypothetical protein
MLYIFAKTHFDIDGEEVNEPVPVWTGSPELGWIMEMLYNKNHLQADQSNILNNECSGVLI